MKKLSFILPVYNVEPYLEKCIRSIADKNMPAGEYEIIVINDGSPDNSEALVNELKKNISNIILLSQKNAGVSVARNKGIEAATGEYIVFIDPDDYINSDLLCRLYNRANKDNLDILLCGWTTVKPNGERSHKVGYQEQESTVYNGVEAFYEKDKPYPIFDHCWGRLYKRSLVVDNNVYFPEKVVHLEDGVFVRKIFTLADRVGFENCDFYQVYERPGSATRSDLGKSTIAAEGDIISVKDLIAFKNANQLNSSQAELIETSILKYILLPLMRAINAKDMNALRRHYKMLVAQKILPVTITSTNKNDYFKYARALNKSLWFFTISYLFDLLKRKYKSN